MSSKLVYKMVGFEGLNIRENNGDTNIRHEYISSIHLNDDLTRMVVYLKDKAIDKEAMKRIDEFLNHICFNMILFDSVKINKPVRILEQAYVNGVNQIHDSINVYDTLSITVNLPAENFYKSVVNNNTALDKHYVLYDRIFKILHNENRVVQFLSLYEMIMELTAKGERKAQKNVVAYLKLKKDEYPEIQFTETSLENRTFEVDTFTSLRNEIAHCEKHDDREKYVLLGKDINDFMIKLLCRVLNDLILEM